VSRESAADKPDVLIYLLRGVRLTYAMEAGKAARRGVPAMNHEERYWTVLNRITVRIVEGGDRGD